MGHFVCTVINQTVVSVLYVPSGRCLHYAVHCGKYLKQFTKQICKIPRPFVALPGRTQCLSTRLFPTVFFFICVNFRIIYLGAFNHRYAQRSGFRLRKYCHVADNNGK